MKIGIIGGTGVEQWEGAKLVREYDDPTAYGAPSAALQCFEWSGQQIWFLSRHGDGHVVAPHLVNYRANIQALRDAGVTTVIALNAVGVIGRRCPVGGIALPAQLIDYTWGRASTFFDGEAAPLQHIDFSEPYTETLRQSLLAVAREHAIDLADGGVYGATQGPRLETAAEVGRLERDGVDYIGMTGAPEAALAREAGLQYACLALVVNAAAGRGSIGIHAELEHQLAGARGQATELVRSFVASLPQN
ncbi:MAG: S-methyl-5'-thioinosine phosphorylase [Pseudomonadota bacterium]